MSLWSRLVGGVFGPGPDAVLVELEEALRTRNPERFAQICASHSDNLLRWFPGWMELLEREMSAERQTTLYAVARWVAEEKQDKSLLFTWFRPTQTGGTDDTLVAIDELEAEGAYDDAIATLENALRVPGITDEGRAELALRLGRLQFGAGRIAEAESRLRECVGRARATMEWELVAQAESRLYELARWRGDGPSAAMHADSVASNWRRLNEKRRADDWARRSTRVRQGEPLVRAVVQLENGTQFEPEHAPLPLPQGAELILVRNRCVFPPAERKMREGRTLLAGRQFKKARECFRDAGSLDPFNPEPWYELGMMYLDSDDMVSAASAFARVEQQAPGWRDVRAHAWMRDAIVERRSAPAVWRFRRAFASGEADMAKLLAQGNDLATRWDIPPLWLDLGRIREWAGDVNGAAQAYASGMRGKADISTRTWLLVRLSQMVEQNRQAQLLSQAVLLGGDHLAAAEAKLRLVSMETMVG